MFKGCNLASNAGDRDTRNMTHNFRVLENIFDRVQIARFASDEHRSFAVLIGNIRIGAARQEHVDNMRLAILGRVV